MASKVAKYLMRAPQNAPAVTVSGLPRITSNKGDAQVKVGGAVRPTTTSRTGNGGKGK
jgi:hypothetical protein